MPNMADWYRSWGPKMMGQEVIRLDGTIGKYVPQPDNVKKFYQTARSLSNSVAVEGGNDALLFAVSYTNLNSNSIVPKCNLDDRHTLNLRGSINKNRFKIDSKDNLYDSTRLPDVCTIMEMSEIPQMYSFLCQGTFRSGNHEELQAT